MKPKIIDEIHVEFMLYLTLGKIDQELTENKINFIIDAVYSKYKEKVNKEIIEIMFDESFNWWIGELDNETLSETINEEITKLETLFDNEKRSIIETLNQLILLEKKEATSIELDVLLNFTNRLKLAK
jgi:uncharacterized protein YjgD (DUF1641 family)